jgi:hypothetical protein
MMAMMDVRDAGGTVIAADDDLGVARLLVLPAPRWQEVLDGAKVGEPLTINHGGVQVAAVAVDGLVYFQCLPAKEWTERLQARGG